jgi:hypothetical protein
VLIWGSLLLRDAAVWLLLALAMRSLARMAARVRPSDLAWLLAAAGGLLWFRGTLVVLLAAGAALACVVPWRGKRSLAVLAGLGVGFVIFRARIMAILEGQSVEGLKASREALVRDGSTAFDAATFTDPVSALAALPGLLPRVLFGPYPWEWPAQPLPFVLTAVSWLVLMWLAWKGRHHVRHLSVVLGPALVLTGVIALTSGNYGTLDRIRVQVAVMLIPLAAGCSRRAADEGAPDSPSARVRRS